MKYFLHDTSAFEDEKVAELYMKFGYEGVGLFFVILEKIAFQEKPVKTKVLKNQLRIGKRLERCWKFMEEIGLINTNNGETFNKQLLNYSGKYQIKKEKNRKRVSEWRERQDDTENVTCYESVRNSPKVKESKVKESKESNIIEQDKTDESILVEKYGIDNEMANVVFDWLEYKKERRETYKSDRSVKSFITKLRNLSGDDPAKAREIVEQSFANNYAGVFELKNNTIHEINKGDIARQHREREFAERAARAGMAIAKEA